MSHFEAYVCKVNNLDFVKKALTEMGYGHKANTTITDYYNGKVKVDLAVVGADGRLLPVGFRYKDKEASNELECQADWYKVPFGEKEFTNRVAQLHDKYTVVQMCEENRWNINDEDITLNESGELEILATNWS